jgi:enoyl-CoA hydratase/carnithine racemase
MTNYETLLVDVSESKVMTVTLNRPEKKNAINATMWWELHEIFSDLRHRDAARVLVITGAGDGFCSGADITGGDPNERPNPFRSTRRLTDMAMLLNGLPQPTIAKVNGVAAGAGCNMALGCDLIVASDRARFSEIYVQRGLSLDFAGSWLLPRLIGLHKAKELALFGDVIDAAEADRLGIVNHVVPADELDGFVDAWAERLAASAPIALAQTKRLLNLSVAPSLHDALVADGAAASINHGTDDTKEALAAFREKRAPKFLGR